MTELVKPKIFYTTAEVAEMLDCNVRRIGDMRRHGLLKGIRTGHGYVYAQTELEEWYRTFRGFDLSNTEKIRFAGIEKGRCRLGKAKASK